LLGAGAAISLGAELLGTSTGLPFGPYQYTTLLGYRIADLVPFPIPLSWFFMVYCCLAICGRLLPARDDPQGKLVWSFAAGAILTAWDVSMDPAMSRATSHWVWHTDGFFYGMPLSNWFGWFLTGAAVARAMLTVAPPSAFARQVSPSSFPIVLYAINGVMPLALVARHGMWAALIAGGAAMGVPIWLAVRRGPRAAVRAAERRSVETGGPPSPVGRRANPRELRQAAGWQQGSGTGAAGRGSRFGPGSDRG
jgi:putative membrane protein